jgi:two-component system, OmpR family, KDP operon response regulator KdpE
VREEVRMSLERVLIVDDEQAIRTYLRIALSAQGYQVLEAENGYEAVEMARVHTPDVVLLDMGLPDVSGVEVTRNLRSWTWVPIIFVSVRDDEQTKVQALDAGADDYLTKPFGLDELLARLRAVLRRKQGIPTEGEIKCGKLTMDQNNRVVTRGEERLGLTPNEFLILQVLMRNCGKLVSHRQILVEVWGPAYADASHVLRVNIFNLRKKLERGPDAGRVLLNEPGLGYRLSDAR